MGSESLPSRSNPITRFLRRTCSLRSSPVSLDRLSLPLSVKVFIARSVPCVFHQVWALLGIRVKQSEHPILEVRNEIEASVPSPIVHHIPSIATALRNSMGITNWMSISIICVFPRQHSFVRILQRVCRSAGGPQTLDSYTTWPSTDRGTFSSWSFPICL
jgi:hypothetical protein